MAPQLEICLGESVESFESAESVVFLTLPVVCYGGPYGG